MENISDKRGKVPAGGRADEARSAKTRVLRGLDTFAGRRNTVLMGGRSDAEAGAAAIEADRAFANGCDVTGCTRDDG